MQPEDPINQYLAGVRALAEASRRGDIGIRALMHAHRRAAAILDEELNRKLPGPIPQKPLSQEDTAPMERDIEVIRDADRGLPAGAPTMKLRTLADLGLVDDAGDVS